MYGEAELTVSTCKSALALDGVSNKVAGIVSTSYVNVVDPEPTLATVL